MQQRYAVVIETGARNFSAYVPDVPGCVATGKTLDIVRRDIARALEFHFRSLARDGDAIPASVTAVDQVERLDPSDLVEVVEVQVPDVATATAR
jgi:predicted RNase H-like HicB family nuclease